MISQRPPKSSPKTASQWGKSGKPKMSEQGGKIGVMFQKHLNSVTHWAGKLGGNFPKTSANPYTPSWKITNKNQQKFPKKSFFLFFLNIFSKSTFSLLENLSKTQNSSPPLILFLLQEIIGEFLKLFVKVKWCSFFHSYNILLFEIETFLYKTMQYLDRVCNRLRKISTIFAIRDIIA